MASNWLTVCQSEHARCQVRQRRKLSQNLIDCRDRTILRISDVASEDCPEYVALSYVWGDSAHQQEKASTSTDKADLPSTLPQVVQDAMQVALKLGYHYLWVDKYCIDHWDKQRKHEQMMHMDSVYQNATLTIVAAAGPDESYGLPGISRRRSSKQVSFEGDNFTLKSILPLPHHSITSSRWASRGWTYQEAILSRRRLVFTEDQLYFECDSTSCCESFRVSKSIQPSGGEPDSSPLSQPSLFCLKRLPAAGTSRRATTRLSNFFTYVNCTKEYSSRSLSYDRDSLTAFSGIIRELESSTAFPVRHIWGIPLFHPDDDNLSVAELQSTYQSFRVAPLWKSASETGCNFAFPSAGAPQGLTWGYSLDTPSLANERVDYLAFLLLGLSWSHESACGARPPRRRIDLPSWSWTGWQGAVAWPALEQSSKVRSLAWLATRIALGDSHTESVPAMYHKGTDLHLLEQSNKSLFITTLAMARTAFSLDKANNRLCLNTGQRVRLRPSKNDMDVPKVHKRLQSGRYEAIVLAMVDQDAFLMLVKKYRNAYYRIGTMSVNVAYLTMSLFTSEVKTYKLR
ncbi:heterokaryon incompatibility protein-domain-containing protein [Astrocystis sublimbata]|nr:heterokaryon incompatibility protein-domain-containing protein [Astrocystis sublimbata]